jgi:hypothetical protein
MKNITKVMGVMATLLTIGLLGATTMETVFAQTQSNGSTTNSTITDNTTTQQ